MRSINETISIQGSDLISGILKREEQIVRGKLELMELWIRQGQDFERLQEAGYSQNRLTEMTKLSKGLINNYLKLSRDKRLVNIINNAGHHGDHHLEDLNQKQVLKLTQLDDKSFYTAIENGAMPIEIKTEQKHSVAKQSRSAPKAVVQFRNGKKVAIYRSAFDAERLTGIDRMSIGKVCRYERVYAGSYSWKFAYEVFGDNNLIEKLKGGQ